MADLGFHWPSLIVYLVNFVILLGVLYAVGYKPILRMLDQRSERIRESVEMAERVRQEAANQQEEMEKRLQEARQEGQSLLAQAREMAERYREEERGKARQEAEAFIARARDDIQRERDEAIEQVRRQFAELAIMAAERVIERSLDSNTHRDIIEKVLEESPQVGRG
ncbi:MAG: F0F1 ATP synthase subunit B [Chloroflexi bacterium]|nr:F0F1 ATP synthase subunit B [Chloroflexota bacterium]